MKSMFLCIYQKQQVRVNTIYNNVPQRRVYPNYIEKVIKNKGHYLREGELLQQHKELLKNKYWLIGHMHYANAKKIWPEAKIYMMFRSPVARIVSHMHHLMREHDHFSGNTFEEILARNNYALRFQAELLGFRQLPPNIQQIKNRIKSLHFIGVTEYFDASLKLLQMQTGWKNIAPLFYNQGGYESDEIKKYSETIIPSPVETMVYKLALEEFAQRCEKANIPLA